MKNAYTLILVLALLFTLDANAQLDKETYKVLLTSEEPAESTTITTKKHFYKNHLIYSDGETKILLWTKERPALPKELDSVTTLGVKLLGHNYINKELYVVYLDFDTIFVDRFASHMGLMRLVDTEILLSDANYNLWTPPAVKIKLNDEGDIQILLDSKPGNLVEYKYSIQNSKVSLLQ